MLILGWLIAGLIAGFLFHDLGDDVSRPSCGPPRWGRAWAVASPTCVPVRPGLVGTPVWKQERGDLWRRMPPPRKPRTVRRGSGPVPAPSARDRYQAPGEVWRVAR